MLDGAAPCRRPLRGPWPTAHPYVLNFGKIGSIPANFGENLAKFGQIYLATIGKKLASILAIFEQKIELTVE